MLDSDPPPPSTHHDDDDEQQKQEGGNGNNLFDPPLPLENDNNALPFDQSNLPPLFSPPSTFLFNTSFEEDDELNPSYQYQYPSDHFFHGFETYDDLFTTPLFHHSYAPTLPPPPPPSLPPPPVASIGSSEFQTKPTSVPIVISDDKATVVAAPPSPPLLPPIVSTVGGGEPSFQQNSIPIIIDVDALPSPSRTEPNIVDNVIVIEPPPPLLPPPPTIVLPRGGEPCQQQNPIPIIIDVDTPSPVSDECSVDEAMIMAEDENSDEDDEPNWEAMSVHDVRVMIDTLLASYAPPFMADPLCADHENQSSKRMKNEAAVDSSFPSSPHADFGEATPMISELDLLRRFLSLGEEGDYLHTMIIEVQKDQDAMDVLTSTAKEKGSLLILGTFGTLSIAQFIEQGMPTHCEGDFIIVSLAGIIVFDGDTQTMNEVSVTVAGVGGTVFGGHVNGCLIADSPLQMVGFTLIGKEPNSPRRLKKKFSIPKIEEVKNKGRDQMKEKNAESEEGANRSQVSIIKEPNENTTNEEEESKIIDEMLAELYTDEEFILGPDECGDVQMVDVTNDQVDLVEECGTTRGIDKIRVFLNLSAFGGLIDI